MEDFDLLEAKKAMLISSAKAAYGSDIEPLVPPFTMEPEFDKLMFWFNTPLMPLETGAKTTRMIYTSISDDGEWVGIGMRKEKSVKLVGNDTVGARLWGHQVEYHRAKSKVNWEKLFLAGMLAVLLVSVGIFIGRAV